jgi:hypothetical protein
MFAANSNAGGEPHPLIQRADNALKRARTDLQNAQHDFCGHRLDALGATNEAIGQLDQALACDSGGKKKSSNDSEIEAGADPSWSGGGEPHPFIYNAINALGAAEGDLQNAAHDYCGHRAAALHAVQHALNQLKAAIACDKK